MFEEPVESLTQEVENTKFNLGKFEAGNMSAGTKARANLQNIKNLCQSLRNEIQEIKNSKKKV